MFNARTWKGNEAGEQERPRKSRSVGLQKNLKGGGEWILPAHRGKHERRWRSKALSCHIRIDHVT